IAASGRQWVPSPTSARRYLLSGIASCSVCGSRLQPRQSSGRTGRPAQKGYGCIEPGCRKVYRSITLLDAYVITRVVARLDHAENPAGRIPDRPHLATEFATLTQARTEAAAAVEDPSNSAHVSLLLARLKRIEERLEQLRELSGESARSRLIRGH